NLPRTCPVLAQYLSSSCPVLAPKAIEGSGRLEKAVQASSSDSAHDDERSQRPSAKAHPLVASGDSPPEGEAGQPGASRPGAGRPGPGEPGLDGSGLDGGE